MPFTFSHPAIILPFGYFPKKWFSWTGLVMGSIAPDFEYFLRMRTESQYSHTIAGLFWFNLPLAVLLAFIFHTIIRNVLFDNLPASLQLRLNGFKDFHWNQHFRKHWFVIFVSILTGAASHLFWDNFTHVDGYFVERISALRNSIAWDDISIPVYKIAQHASTIIGGACISIVILNLPKQNIQPTSIDIRYWIAIGISSVIIMAIRFITGLDYHLYGHVIVSGISAFLLSLSIISVLYLVKSNSSI